MFRFKVLSNPLRCQNFQPLRQLLSETNSRSNKHHKASKKGKYEQRIVNVEKNLFQPLVFATTGGAGPPASRIATRVAVDLSGKTSEPYADVVEVIRTKLSFALLRSSILLTEDVNLLNTLSLRPSLL